LLTQVPVVTLETPFYLQRADGWLLAVPEAGSRDEGILQLIQAFVKLDQDPKLQTKLRRYYIRPFKM
jgi:mannitol/fructose-specific phosphotransferase system IIA component (Ntr-type)